MGFTAGFNHNIVVTHLIEQGVTDKTVTSGEENSLAVSFRLNDLLLLLGGQIVRVGWLQLALDFRGLRGLRVGSLWFDGKFLRERAHFINYLNGNFRNG